jgi:hypothetical protein
MVTQLRFKHVSVRVPPDLDRWLRIEAAKADVSKSHLIRAILSHSASQAAEVEVAHHTLGKREDGPIGQERGNEQ